MSSRSNAARIGTLLLAAVSFAADSRADYIVNGGEVLGTHRIRENGTVATSYFPPPEAAGLYETYGEDFAVAPDLNTLYQFTNNLGISNLIFLYDVPSGTYSTYHVLNAGAAVSPDEFLIFNATMSLVRPYDPLEAGDLFTISGSFPFMSGLTPQIKRFNRAANEYVETIDPPTEQSIYDFAFGPDNRLYMAAETGVYVYVETATGFDLVSPTPLLGTLTGKLTFGPDGRMYLMNSATGSIERYMTDGTFVDSFISTLIPSPESRNSSIQFGVDGNIHVLSGPHQINRYHGTTGALLASIFIPSDNPDFQFAAMGRVVYLAIPEPSSLLLAAMAASFVGARRRGKPLRD